MKFTSDWFSHYVPLFQKYLNKHVGVQSRFLEIGCYEGRSAIWMMDNLLTHKHSRLFCIDPFNGEYANTFYSNLGESGHGHAKCKVIADFSYNALKKLADNQFDFIYIDGDHGSNAVLYDAVTCFPLLKQGGIIAFDDYAYNHHGMRPELEFCKVGVDAFLSAYSLKIEVLHKDYQVWAKRL